MITPNGIKPNPITTQAVQNFPIPKNVRETQSFLGLANYYRRFIPKVSAIAEPLTKLTRKGTPFIFSDDCHHAFEQLKTSLIQPPILKYPDTSRPFLLTTDASDYSLGAKLSQIYPAGEFPVAYASRALGKSERNYSTIEKEMLGIYWAVNNFRPYLYGKKFTIITDHKPLTGNLSKIPNRILKWNLKLSEYNFEIIHKSGKLNTNADALSRIRHNQVAAITRAQDRANIKKTNDMIQTNTPTTIPEVNPSEKAKKDEKDMNQTSLTTPNPNPAQDNKDTSPNTTTNPNTKIPSTSTNTDQKIEVILDQKRRQQILNEYHDLPLGGHAGTWRTYKRIKMLYYWPNMLTDINRHIRRCQLCKRNKTHRRTRMPLQITSTSDHPFQRVAFDIVGPLPTTENGNNYLLTFQDDLSKFSGAIPIQNQESTTVAKALCEQYITKYGIPEKILTDQGSNFMSKTFNDLCKLLKLKHLTTTAYHPQTNGALEKSHNTLKEYLRSFTDIDRNNWDEMCHYAIFVYNTTPHCSTNYTPHELVYGRPALIPTAIRKEPEPVYNFDDYVTELKARLRLAHAIARGNLLKKKEATKQQYDKRINSVDLKLGDLVWVKNEARRNKQDPIWLGPYKIIRKDSPTNVTIQMNRRAVKIHINRLIKNGN